jgi:hypothetical protein
VFGRVTHHLGGGGKRVFDFAVVDEAQDVGIAELRFLAALGSSRADGLFLTGDLGQRIFQQPFSWKSLGVDIRGRSYTLLINYRTSHQIRSHADRLLPLEVADVDGNSENRRGTISVFNGVEPVIETFANPDQEATSVGGWLADRIAEGVSPQRNRNLRSRHRSAAACPRGRQDSRRDRGRAKRQDRNVARPHLHRHDASGQRSGVPRRRGHGLRRRGNPAAGAH